VHHVGIFSMVTDLIALIDILFKQVSDVRVNMLGIGVKRFYFLLFQSLYVVLCDAELEKRLRLHLFHCARSIQNHRAHEEAVDFSETVRDRFVKLNAAKITEIALNLQRRTNHFAV